MPARVVLSPRTLREQGKSWNLQPWLADAGSVLPGASRCSPAEENAASLPGPHSLPGFASCLATFQVINSPVWLVALILDNCSLRCDAVLLGIGHWVAMSSILIRT